MNITPKPTRYTAADGSYTVCKGTGIACEFDKIGKNLNGYIELLFGYKLSEREGISFTLTDGDFGEEGYALKVSDSGIAVTAATEKGLFYGAQSIKQLLTEYKSGDSATIPAADIFDKPAYPYRGFHFDVARHFFDADEVKKLIDVCSLLKLNVFHWHLTEDQGWRIPIDKYPNLIAVGSKRSSTRDDGVPVEGSYTKAEIREIVAYAADRYMDVMPEVDMPGHMTAAIASYPHLSCEGKQVEVATRFGIKSTILCAGKETTYEFVQDVLNEVVELFPYKYFHIGGDEAVKQKWQACPLCQKTMQENGLCDEEDLQAYFTEKVVEMLKSLGKTAVVWNEACNSGKLHEDCVLQYWREPKGAKNVKAELKKGRKMIISQFTPYYLDYPHGMHPLRAVYKFNPRIGEGDIIGVESPLWTEYIATVKQVETQYFPRLFALAERGWTNPDKKGYPEFKKRVEYTDKVLDVLGVQYTSTAEADVARPRGIIDMLKFFANIVDKQMIAETKENNAATRATAAKRRNKE